MRKIKILNSLSCIFLLFLTSLTLALDDEIKINDDTGTTTQIGPVIAMNNGGYAVICWRDDRTSLYQIYAQIMGDKGYKFKTNFQIESIESRPVSRFIRVAMANDGRFVVVWSALTIGMADETIFARVYLSNGVALTEAIPVPDRNEDDTHSMPDVAMDQQGNFVVTWSHAIRFDQQLVLARLFDRNGNALTPAFAVDNSATTMQTYPRINRTSAGNFAITWLNVDGGFSNVFFRKFDHAGRALTSVKRISQHEGQSEHIDWPHLAIRMLENGNLAIAWAYGKTSTRKDIFARFYTAGNDSWSDQVQVTPVTWGGKNTNPVIGGFAPNHPLQYFITWDTDKYGNMDIYSLPFLENGMAATPTPTRINQENAENQSGLAVGSTPDMKATIFAWSDTRNGNYDIYARLSGTNHLFNTVAASGFNKIVPIFWDHPYREQGLTKYSIRRSEAKTGPFTTVAELDLSDRGVLGTELRDWVDQDVQNDQTYYYLIHADYSGPLSGTYSDTISATPTAGMPVINSPYSATNPTIDGVINPNEWREALVIRGNHYFMASSIMTYIKNSRDFLYLAFNAEADLFLDPANSVQLIFDKDHNKKWGDNSANSDEGVISITPTQMTFTKLWGGYPNHLGADPAKPASGVFSKMSTEQGHVQIEIAIDLVSSPLKITPGQTFGMALLVEDPGQYTAFHYGYEAELPKGVIWENPQTFISVTLAASTGIDTAVEPVNDFNLQQNYPNPFNAATILKYNLPAATQVQLTIYALNGRLVRTLVNQHQAAGSHTIEWNGQDDFNKPCASGLYLYRLTSTESSEARKMLLLK